MQATQRKQRSHTPETGGQPKDTLPDTLPDTAPQTPDTITFTAPDRPLSFSEAAKLIRVHPDTLRKRHWPRIVDALSDRDIQLQIETGKTQAGSPIYKLSPLAIELLYSFQSVAGNCDEIVRWQAETAAQFPLLPIVAALEPEPEPTPEPEPLEPAGQLSLIPRADAQIVIDCDWLEATGELIESDFAAAAQAQTDLATTIESAGEALRQSLEQLADQHSAAALASYQSRLQSNIAAMLGGNVVGGKKQAAGSAP